MIGIGQAEFGQYRLDDMEITDFPMYKRAQQGIGYLAQEASVFRKLSIEDNILSVLQLTKLSKAEQEAKMESLIDEFSLQHIRTNRGDLLSGVNDVVPKLRVHWPPTPNSSCSTSLLQVSIL
jgi:lipopolysaccharide export system ATP-binding protein